ncbi:hypothetical protein PALU110988_12740 [Paenibacillus lupini]|nr:hypothetical protein [Paenibacillus lupini]
MLSPYVKASFKKIFEQETKGWGKRLIEQTIWLIQWQLSKTAQYFGRFLFLLNQSLVDTPRIKT